MLPQGVEISRLSRHVDPRGALVELWRSDETGHPPAMGYLSLTVPGQTRGPHEHLAQSDWFVFAGGGVTVRLWENRPRLLAERPQPLVLRLTEDLLPVRLLIPPGVVHSYTADGPGPCMVINLPDALYAGPGRRGPVDEVRWEHDPNALFQIDGPGLVLTGSQLFGDSA